SNWPALCPNPPAPGEKLIFDEQTLSFYRQLLRGLKDDGITTFVTLFHFTLPNWLAQKGGWCDAQIVDHFESFTKAAAEALGDVVDYWITLNEPLAYAYQ